jgi:hypothetical protein
LRGVVSKGFGRGSKELGIPTGELLSLTEGHLDVNGEGWGTKE